MKWFKNILIYTGLLVLVLLLISFFLPRKVSVERTLEIEAPTSVVFGMIDDVRKWQEWLAWHDQDPELFVRYRSRVTGRRAGFFWHSNRSELGSGRLMIMVREPYGRIEADAIFENRGEATYTFELEGIGPDTRITLRFSSEFEDNPLHRYVGLRMEKLIAVELEKSLENLKSVSENHWRELRGISMQDHAPYRSSSSHSSR